MPYFIKSLLVALTLSLAQQAMATEIRVFVEANANDPIGTRLVFAVKEAIRRSAAMSLTDVQDDSLVRLSIVTLNPDSGERSGSRTAYSIVWSFRSPDDDSMSIYYTSTVGICGTNRVAVCAEGLVADTDSNVSHALRARDDD